LTKTLSPGGADSLSPIEVEWVRVRGGQHPPEGQEGAIDGRDEK